MRALYSLLLVLPLTAMGQTIHPVNVGGTTLDENNLPYYAPSTLIIPVGDIVRWTNVNGTHNVNGGEFFFPDNPVPFSFTPALGVSQWSYQFTFDVPGTYHYHCDTEGHSATQSGVIIVESDNSIGESRSGHTMTLFPTPAGDHVTVDIGDRRITRAELSSVDGRILGNPAFTSAARTIQIHISDLTPGNYLLRLVEQEGTSTTMRFTKK